MCEEKIQLYNEDSIPMNCLAADDVGGFREALHIDQGRRFVDTREFIGWLTALDMAPMLGVPNRCRCFFHEDHNPSASLYFYKGQSLYCCHAGCTESPLSIIGLYEKLHQCSYTVAVNELACFFDADIETPSLFLPTGDIRFLDKNQELLEQIPDKAPVVFSILKTELESLHMLMEIAKRSAMPFENGVLLSVSGRYLNTLLPHTIRPSCTLALLHYFGLLRRLRLDEIPPPQMERLERFSEQQYQRSLEQGFDQEAEVYQKSKHRLISQTVLFPYEETGFYEKLEETAHRWKALGYAKRSLSYAQIAKREDPFLALDCFPQTENHDDIKEVKEDEHTAI